MACTQLSRIGTAQLGGAAAFVGMSLAILHRAWDGQVQAQSTHSGQILITNPPKIGYWKHQQGLCATRCGDELHLAVLRIENGDNSTKITRLKA
jgi:hypothetical protein